MADEADFADETIERDLAAGIAATARDIEPGVAGVCRECEQPSKRLILGACARCRDEFNLP